MTNQLTTRPQYALPALPVKRSSEISGVVQRHAFRLYPAKERGVMATDLALQPETRAALQSRLNELYGALQPAMATKAGKDRSARAIALMLSGFTSAKNLNAEETTASFLFTMQDLPVFAIEEACRDVASGRVEKLNPDFPPTTARLHQLAAAKCAWMGEESYHIGQVLNARYEEPPTEEERQRISDGLEQLADDLRATQAAQESELYRRKPAPPLPLKPEEGVSHETDYPQI